MRRRLKEFTIHRPVVWVVGASRGIGREISRQFASIGCEVAVSSRSKENLVKVVKDIDNLGGRAYSFPCDINRRGTVFAVARRIHRKLGPVDVLVNNASITVFKSFLNTTTEEFRNIFDTNLLGPILCTKAVLPSMVKRRQGWIFNILSNAAVKTFEDSTAYTATKAGMLGFGRVLREELRRYNIKVVNVLPGPVETAMWKRDERRRFSRRMMKPKSVAESILAVYQMPDDIVVDQIVLRPMQGDID